MSVLKIEQRSKNVGTTVLIPRIKFYHGGT
jgi:hypothetical protein